MATKTASKTPAKPAAKRAPSKTAAPDALALLRADHVKVSGLFEKFESTRSSAQKQKLATQICSELKVHTQIEEEIFYPELRAVADIDDMLNEADVEHDGAKKLIADIEAGSPEAPLFDAQVKVLSEYIKHHVKEEQNQIFPVARKSGLDLKDVGERLAARKKELMRAGAPGSPPSPQPR